MQSLSEERSLSKKLKATIEIAKAILMRQGKTSPENTASGDEIYSEYEKSDKEKDPSNSVVKSTFIQYLSIAARTRNTEILCNGRRQGYYVRDETITPAEESNLSSDTESIDVNEDSLYPIFKGWLIGKGYSADVVSSGKRNGPWGNPDVVGLKVYENFGTIESELVSIECKKGFSGWQKWMFEAVAHTRFVDRAYFAFAFPQDEIQKQTDELIPYAEYFGVGILVLELEKEAYDNYINGKGTDLSKGEILELLPASLNRPITTEKIRYLSSIGVNTITDLYNFGNDSGDVNSNPSQED